MSLDARTAELFKRLQQNPEAYKSKTLSNQDFSTGPSKTVSIEKNKNKKLLVFKELRLAFNPLTGLEDSNFNEKSRFRFDGLPSTVLKLSYDFARNEGSVDNYNRQIGYNLTEEELNSGEFTKELIDSLEALIDAEDQTSGMLGSMVASDPAITINNELFTKRNYPVKYTIDYDPAALAKLTAEEREAQTPFFRKLKYFEASLTKEEIEILKETEKYKQSSNNDQRDARKAIYQRAVMGDFYPINYYIVLEVPLNANGEIEVDLSAESVEELAKRIKIIKKYKDLSTAIGNTVKGKAKNKYNNYLDFYNIDLFGGQPTSGVKKDEYKEILESTTYEVSNALVPATGDESALLSKLPEAFNKVLAGKTIDELLKEWMPASRTLKGGVSDKALAKAFGLIKTYDKIRPYLTDNAILNMKDYLSIMYPENFKAMLDGDFSANISESKEEDYAGDAEALGDKSKDYSEDESQVGTETVDFVPL